MAPLPIVLEERPLLPLSAEAAMHLVEHGLLGEDPPKFELLHGVLVIKPPSNPPHEVLKARLNMWLARGIDPAVHELRVESPSYVADPYSIPVPDLMVIAADTGFDHPRAASLVIEVADSSLRLDRKVKAPLYAATGNPEYWIVDVNACAVHVLTDPTATGYAKEREIKPPTPLQPQNVAIEPLDSTKLFEGLSPTR